MESNVIDGVTVFLPEDTLDLTGYLDFGAEIDAALHEGQKKIVLDCTNVSYINSSSIAVITSISQRAVKAGGGVAFANVGSGAGAVLQASGILKTVRVCSSVEDAVKLLA